MKKILLVYGMMMASPLHASMVSLDTLYVSTIAGQTSSNGITISSSIYLVSGASLTLQGAGGYIINASSITASTYFGDGSHLRGVTALTSTQTFSGANTFLSSFTVQSAGRQIILSTSTSVNNIAISTAGIVSFYPSLHNSTSTIVPFYQATNTSFGPCVPGSTLTITTNGGLIEVSYAGNLSNTLVGSDNRYLSFLQDGSFVRDLDTQKSIADFRVGASGLGAQSFSYLIDSPPPTAGVHSYCLTLRALNGNNTVIGDDTSSSQRCTSIFYVKELK